MRHLLSASSPALSGRSLCVAVALLRLATGTAHRHPPHRRASTARGPSCRVGSDGLLPRRARGR